MSDLLDKHSPDYDPDAFVALVDDDRKRRKENPAAFAIKNVYTGELLDPDDLQALKAALKEIEDYLADKRRPLRPIYETRDQIQARVAELEPIGLPRPRNQTKRQQRVRMCPRCLTVIEDSDSDPQAAASSPGVTGSSGEGTSTSAVSTATLAEEQSSESEESAAAGPAADMAPPKELSPPAGDVRASPAPSLKEAS